MTATDRTAANGRQPTKAKADSRAGAEPARAGPRVTRQQTHQGRQIRRIDFIERRMRCCGGGFARRVIGIHQ